MPGSGPVRLHIVHIDHGGGSPSKGHLVIIFPECEMRIVGADSVDPISADEADVVNVVSGKGLQRPIEQTLALDLGKAFRRFSRGRHKTTATSGTNDNCSHDSIAKKAGRLLSLSYSSG